jgi:predicted MFS family arabinose efflux permease
VRRAADANSAHLPPLTRQYRRLKLHRRFIGGDALRNRWGVLAVLFAVRLTMAFQFQSVAAIAPLLSSRFGASLADIGVLIGLYFTPGVALSLPGGAVGQKFGDKATAIGALLVMVIGNLAMALGDSWSWQIAGRLVAGAGGVLLNVQLTKMVADWFAGHEIATAMAILVNSWPAGIAVALLTLPHIGTAYGTGAVELVVTALIAMAAALAASYRPPKDATTITSASAARLDVKALLAVAIAGVMWGLFNVGFAMIFSFGPSMLAERGWSIAAAGSAISVVLWVAVVGVPLGGVLADRINRPQTILVAGCLLFALLMVVLPRTSAVIPAVIALGLISGQPAGPLLSLPARVLQPATRAIGMGVFYTLYYGAMMLGPAIAGAAAKWTGSAGVALDFGAAVLIVCPLLLLGFNHVARSHPPSI